MTSDVQHIVWKCHGEIHACNTTVYSNLVASNTQLAKLLTIALNVKITLELGTYKLALKNSRNSELQHKKNSNFRR